jgi:hypothetical protein
VCAAQSCSAGVESSARTCDGAGTCLPATTKSCAPYACSGVACATSCAKHADCPPGQYCGGGACASLATGLSGHWKLDESASPAQDSSGNMHTGVWQGTPTGDTATVAPLRAPNAASLRCDRADGDRVRIGRSPSLEPTGAFTVAAWIRRLGNADQANGWAALLRKSWMDNKSPSFGSYALQLPRNAWDTVAFGTGHQGSIHELHSGANTIPDGVWTHVAAIYDPAGAAPQKRLYINGALNAMATLTAAVVTDSTATGDLFLCHPGGAGLEYLNGQLDDVRVYSRALSATEVAALAAGQ